MTQGKDKATQHNSPKAVIFEKLAASGGIQTHDTRILDDNLTCTNWAMECMYTIQWKLGTSTVDNPSQKSVLISEVN